MPYCDEYPAVSPEGPAEILPSWRIIVIRYVWGILLWVFFLAPGALAGPGDPSLPVAIPVGGNTWVVNSPEATTRMIADSGLSRWVDSTTIIRTFFWTEQAGEIGLGLRARVTGGRSRLAVTLGNLTTDVSLSNARFDTIPVGHFVVRTAGYQRVDLRGIEKTGETFAEVTDLLISGSATKGNVSFVRNEFYWGRRGPSVHLNYGVPAGADDVRWFYNEITVPDREDVVGSYFMACGFAEGYFGIQVNSQTERRILFSVWSPFKTDDPSKIPDGERVLLLKKGEDVHAGSFGDEGSGGQSYRRYSWKPGVTYRCLLRGEPAEDNSTDFTAYFYAPERGIWELIATFRRPKTTTGLTHLHSFLENFLPETGLISRRVVFSNPWVCDASGRWRELTRATLSADATAKKGSRLDFQGGVENDSFFLRNCGFFNETSIVGSTFTRREAGIVPDVARLP
jgi:hypothetical protein